MKKRVLTGIVMMAIFLPLLIVDDLFNLFQILMMGLALMASIEMVNLYEKDVKFPGISKVIIVISSMLVYLSFTSEFYPKSLSSEGLKLFNIYIGFVPTLVIITILLFSLMVLYDDFNGVMIGKALTINIYCGIGFAAITVLRCMGLSFVLYLFAITIFTDVFAYVFGMLFGKHKMCPKISPKKTWEGAFGGTITATVVATLFVFMYGKMSGNPDLITIFHGSDYMNFTILSRPMQIVFIICLTIAASIIGQIGDLVASKFKRTYDIKDFSNIFPGHGGVLDRLDSAIFVSMFLMTVILVFKNFAM